MNNTGTPILRALRDSYLERVPEGERSYKGFEGWAYYFTVEHSETRPEVLRALHSGELFDFAIDHAGVLNMRLPKYKHLFDWAIPRESLGSSESFIDIFLDNANFM